MDTAKDQFIELIKRYYAEHKRDLEWRETITPYGVVVSEIMLQQTQVPRVQTKFPEFMAAFPTFEVLAKSTVSEVLAQWQGMGYNRRGLYLRQIAQVITEKYAGNLPKEPELVDELPGIGPATAASIVAYTYNIPTVFIETNIRRVFIHHFFADKEGIDDKDIYPLVAETVDKENPREWYYALMDYGTALAKQVPNPNRKSKHYTKQSKFEGSKRQIRGQIVKWLVKQGEMTEAQISGLYKNDTERVRTILLDMEKEGFLVRDKTKYRLP